MGILGKLFGKKSDKDDEVIKPYRNSNRVIIGFEDTVPTEYKKTEEESEEEICRYIQDTITQNREINYKFAIAHKSKDYTTLVYRKNDLVRVKWTPVSKWLAIQMNSKALCDKYRDDPIFDVQENKNQVQWKTICIDKNDIETRMSIILESFDAIDGYHFVPDPLSDTEKEYLVAAGKIIAEVSDDPDSVYYEKTTEKFLVSYKGTWLCRIEFRLYKRKNHRCFLDVHDAKDLKLYKRKIADYPGYVEFEDPIFFKSLIPYIKQKYEDCCKSAQYFPSKEEMELTGTVLLNLNS